MFLTSWRTRVIRPKPNNSLCCLVRVYSYLHIISYYLFYRYGRHDTRGTQRRITINVKSVVDRCTLWRIATENNRYDDNNKRYNTLRRAVSRRRGSRKQNKSLPRENRCYETSPTTMRNRLADGHVTVSEHAPIFLSVPSRNSIPDRFPRCAGHAKTMSGRTRRTTTGDLVQNVLVSYATCTKTECLYAISGPYFVTTDETTR